MWVVALAALGADDEPALQVVAEGPAHHAQVLVEHEAVGGGHAHHLVGVLLQELLAIFGRITLGALRKIGWF